MASLKTGTVEIHQHVETTPTVSKHFVVGTILMSQYSIKDSLRSKGEFGTFTVIGRNRVFTFLGQDYVTVKKPGDYTASSNELIVDDAKLISYLRLRAQKILGDVIQEIEEGVFDD